MLIKIILLILYPLINRYKIKKKGKQQMSRKMLITLPNDINEAVVKKQLELERSGKKVLKPQAVIEFIRELMGKNKMREALKK